MTEYARPRTYAELLAGVLGASNDARESYTPEQRAMFQVQTELAELLRSQVANRMAFTGPNVDAAGNYTGPVVDAVMMALNQAQRAMNRPQRRLVNASPLNPQGAKRGPQSFARPGETRTPYDLTTLLKAVLSPPPPPPSPPPPPPPPPPAPPPVDPGPVTPIDPGPIVPPIDPGPVIPPVDPRLIPGPVIFKPEPPGSGEFGLRNPPTLRPPVDPDWIRAWLRDVARPDILSAFTPPFTGEPDLSGAAGLVNPPTLTPPAVVPPLEPGWLGGARGAGDVGALVSGLMSSGMSPADIIAFVRSQYDLSPAELAGVARQVQGG